MRHVSLIVLALLRYFRDLFFLVRGYMPAYWKNDPPAGNGNPNVIRLSFRNPGVDTESILRGYYDSEFHPGRPL